MRKINLYPFIYLLIFPFINTLSQKLELEAFTKSAVEFPAEIANAGDNRLFVINQSGKIFMVDSTGTVNSSPFLDISDLVNWDFGQKGLLGLAFPSNYGTTGKFYVYYIDKNDSTVISRFNVSAGNENIADKTSEKRLITYPQPANDHKAGCMKFGPDGYLYIASGDGGKPTNGVNAKDHSSFLGKILRIDVSGDNYSIPLGNPFAASQDTLKEIWAYGVRNPWKISFDRQTGDFWIGDVGADLWDEIDFQPAQSTGGENYGWPCYEADVEFINTDCPGQNTMIFPVATYYQEVPSIKVSVTGGFVYRGNKYPAFKGIYIYTEAYTGKIFGLQRVNEEWVKHDLGTVDEFIVSFGEDKEGELYASGYIIPGYADEGNHVYKVKLSAPDGWGVNIRKGEVKYLVTFFPNPVEDVIWINSDLQLHSYSIYGIEGKRTASGIIGPDRKIDVSSIYKGIYMIRFYNEKGSLLSSSKFIKQ